MNIILPQDFYKVLNTSHLLLDTSVFIDAFLNPFEWGRFFNELKTNGITLTSLDAVKIEFLKGAQDSDKYKQKDEFFTQIIDACLPTTNEVFENVYKLIKDYKNEGKSLSVADFLLGAALLKYQENLFLLSKSTTEFPSDIFKLSTYFNIHFSKGLHTYGVYQTK